MNSIFRFWLLLFVGGFCSRSTQAAPSVGAQVVVKVEVSGVDQTRPFDRERVLKVPEGARISVLARVDKARFLAVSPQGDILVSQPDSGKILLVRKSGPSEAKVYELIRGLRLPHGMVFQRVGDTLYLYVGESNRISRFVYSSDALSRDKHEI